MKPGRKDVLQDGKTSICRKSTLIGYSTNKLKPGDMFIFKHPEHDQFYYGKSFGRIKGTDDGRIKGTDDKWMILTQTLSENLQFSYERWIDPDHVIEIIPACRINKHLNDMFLQHEGNQIYVFQEENRLYGSGL